MVPRHASRSFALLAVLAASGCGARPLVASPHVVTQQDPATYFERCRAGAGAEMEVLYATDRDVDHDRHGPAYGHGRSKRLAYGSATVVPKPHDSWDEFARESTRRLRRHGYTLGPGECRELGAFHFRWEQLAAAGDEADGPEEALVIPAEQRQAFHDVLAGRLAETGHKDVYVFVHGFNNAFGDAVYRAAELWHFLGRVGVPVAYSWPAGRGGPRGYLYDRESGEFTVFHLKQFLACVAACPQVERVHVVAHSRGTDVAISALRELHIACRARGRSTRAELKLENLVLAAPDLDEEVFVQRFVAENLLAAAGRTTIYTSPGDRAIELADLAFASRRRIGQLGPRDFSPRVRAALARQPRLQFVECRVTHLSTSHDYVFAHPAALSDLILVLRDRRPPGAEHGRPLRQPVEGVWELTDDYLRDAATPGG